MHDKTFKLRVHTVNGNVVFRSDIHTHAANTAEVYARRVSSTLVSSVVSVHESTRNIIRDAIQGCSENALAVFYSKRTLSRHVQCARHRLNPTIYLPIQHSGFDIPNQ